MNKLSEKVVLHHKNSYNELNPVDNTRKTPYSYPIGRHIIYPYQSIRMPLSILASLSFEQMRS
jgi:hypothetical protein